MEPREIPVHGGRAVLTVQGDDFPAYAEVRTSFAGPIFFLTPGDTPTERHINLPPGEPGPFSLTVESTYFLHDAGTYVVTPAAPVLTSHPWQSTLPFPLPPELAGPCARVLHATLENTGDELLEGGASLSGATAFSLRSNTCAHSLRYRESCQLEVCFESAVPGTYVGSLDAGTASIALHATVGDPSMGLDASFHGTGAHVLRSQYTGLANVSFRYTNVAALADGGVLAWYRYSAAITGVDATAEAATYIGAIDLQGFPASLIADVQPAAAGGAYAIVGDDGGASYGALIAVNSAGVRDMSFAGTGHVPLPLLVGGNYWQALEQQPSGRLVALGTARAIAYSPAGVRDMTFGGTGETALPGAQIVATAVDSTGRIYLSLTTDQVIRLNADGTLDTSFTHALEVSSLAIDTSDWLLAGIATGVVRIADGSAPEPLPQLGTSPVFDLALDESGRIYVTTVSGTVTRYAGDLTLDRTFGFGTAKRVSCPSTGACTIYGIGYYAIAGAEMSENYLLRLAP